MTNRGDGDNYPGFDDVNDFLPDPSGSDREGPAADPARDRPGKRRLRLLPRILLAILILGAAVFILNHTLMKIRHVRIVGCRTLSVQEVAAQAGLNQDMGFFTVDRAKVRTQLERNPYLEYVDLKRRFPDTLVLYIRERAPCANVQGAGAMYLVDEYAYVLRSISNMDVRNSLPVVIGMQVSDAKVGRQLASNRSGKVQEYIEVMQELLQQNIVNEYDLINLTDSNHVYLRHLDGFMADLGSTKELMAKIGTLRAVVTELQRSGMKNGYIDVSIPGEAIYTPE